MIVRKIVRGSGIRSAKERVVKRMAMRMGMKKVMLACYLFRR
jgi:hypothetical protein